MEKKIFELIKDQFHIHSGFGLSGSAKEIASLMIGFMSWVRDNVDTGNYTWDLGDDKDYTTEELFQYWLDNINK